MVEQEQRISQSLREELATHHLRIALYPDLKEQRYVLECQACGEATEFQPASAVPYRCYTCDLSWDQTPPRFWVLLPKKEAAGA